MYLHEKSFELMEDNRIAHGLPTAASAWNRSLSGQALYLIMSQYLGR